MLLIALLQTIIYKYLWKGPDKEKRTAIIDIINSLGKGGLNLTDQDTLNKSLRLTLIAKLSTAEKFPWFPEIPAETFH